MRDDDRQPAGQPPVPPPLPEAEGGALDRVESAGGWVRCFGDGAEVAFRACDVATVYRDSLGRATVSLKGEAECCVWRCRAGDAAYRALLRAVGVPA